MSDSKTKIDGDDRLFMAGLIHNLLLFSAKVSAIQTLRRDTLSGMGEISNEETIRLLLPLIDSLQVEGSAAFLLNLLDCNGTEKVTASTLKEIAEGRRSCYTEVDIILNGGGAMVREGREVEPNHWVDCLDPEDVYQFYI